MTSSAIKYRAARYVEGGLIDCEIEHPEHGWIPFTLNPKDPAAGIDVAALFAEISKEGDVAAYSPDKEKTAAISAHLMAVQANELLAKSDLVVMRCFERSKKLPASWVAYREKLRQIVRGDAEAISSGIPDRPAFPA